MADTTRVRPGQLLMVGLPGPTLDLATRSFLKSHAVGGVILFRRNIVDVRALVALTSELHSIATEDRPILVAIDHEGGRVLRLGKPFTQFPSAAVVGSWMMSSLPTTRTFLIYMLPTLPGETDPSRCVVRVPAISSIL